MQAVGDAEARDGESPLVKRRNYPRWRPILCYIEVGLLHPQLRIVNT
jgi:hypothetical protein